MRSYQPITNLQISKPNQIENFFALREVSENPKVGAII